MTNLGITVRCMTTADIPAALTILEQALGQGFITREALKGYAKPGEKLAYVAQEDSGQIIAVATGVIPSDPISLLEMIPADQHSTMVELVPKLREKRSRVGLLKSVAVDPSGRKRGVGTEVSRAVVQTMLDSGAAKVFSIGWTDDEGCHIQRPLEALGFSQREDINDFWREDSVIHGYSCPTCGHPCRCAARIFVL